MVELRHLWLRETLRYSSLITIFVIDNEIYGCNKGNINFFLAILFEFENVNTTKFGGY